MKSFNNDLQQQYKIALNQECRRCPEVSAALTRLQNELSNCVKCTATQRIVFKLNEDVLRLTNSIEEEKARSAACNARANLLEGELASSKRSIDDYRGVVAELQKEVAQLHEKLEDAHFKVDDEEH